MESILEYLEMLEDFIENSRPIPFSSKVSVDREKIYDIIREIRLNLPNEIRQAQRIIEEHDKIINDAKIKASGVIKEAEGTAKMMTNSHEIFKRATEQAERAVEETKKSARDMRLNAMDYADEILAKTEKTIQEAMTNIDQQHQLLADYFTTTMDVLYSNRQELRNGKN
ncbi:MAG: ATPase [Clostridiales bacterium]|jgi:vacuolar-type H+-ATPase subunit H|nr:ATPase [Clostridiales bacterium]MDR2751276.1 ATPase [Clostridiales bacterium]